MNELTPLNKFQKRLHMCPQLSLNRKQRSAITAFVAEVRVRIVFAEPTCDATQTPL